MMVWTMTSSRGVSSGWKPLIFRGVNLSFHRLKLPSPLGFTSRQCLGISHRQCLWFAVVFDINPYIYIYPCLWNILSIPTSCIISWTLKNSTPLLEVRFHVEYVSFCYPCSTLHVRCGWKIGPLGKLILFYLPFLCDVFGVWRKNETLSTNERQTMLPYFLFFAPTQCEHKTSTLWITVVGSRIILKCERSFWGRGLLEVSLKLWSQATSTKKYSVCGFLLLTTHSISCYYY